MSNKIWFNKVYLRRKIILIHDKVELKNKSREAEKLKYIVYQGFV